MTTEDFVNWSDARLLHSAMIGNSAAFAVFCERSLPRLRALVATRCRKYGINADHVGDLCNETIVKVLNTIDRADSRRKYQENPVENTSAWLTAIARNVVLDHVRRTSRSPTVSMEAESESTHLSVEELVELRDLFETLTPRGQSVLGCIYIDGLSIAGTAEKLKMSRAAVHKAHYRALDQLRERLIRPPDQWSASRTDSSRPARMTELHQESDPDPDGEGS